MDFVYQLLLTLHNLGRWLVVGFAIWALVRAYRGWLGKREWTALDNRVGLLYTVMIDTQILLGILLFFFFSTPVKLLFDNFSANIKQPQSLFFGLEHWFGMVVAMGLAHAGRAMSRKAAEPSRKHRIVALWFSASVLVILISIPWPFLPGIARPFFRLFGIVF